MLILRPALPRRSAYSVIVIVIVIASLSRGSAPLCENFYLFVPK